MCDAFEKGMKGFILNSLGVIRFQEGLWVERESRTIKD